MRRQAQSPSRNPLSASANKKPKNSSIASQSLPADTPSHSPAILTRADFLQQRRWQPVRKFHRATSKSSRSATAPLAHPGATTTSHDRKSPSPYPTARPHVKRLCTATPLTTLSSSSRNARFSVEQQKHQQPPEPSRQRRRSPDEIVSSFNSSTSSAAIFIRCTEAPAQHSSSQT